MSRLYVADHIPVSQLRVRGGLSDPQRRRIASYIRDRLGDELALTDLAALVGLGPRQFSKLFSQAFGVTPYQYVLQQRLDEGARRLATGSRSITEVALELGFSNPSPFATEFRDRFAQTPREYVIERRTRAGF